ncbi:hypothetical protein LXL04_033286 [Taraxacum kok-saghyz]
MNSLPRRGGVLTPQQPEDRQQQPEERQQQPEERQQQPEERQQQHVDCHQQPEERHQQPEDRFKLGKDDVEQGEWKKVQGRRRYTKTKVATRNEELSNIATNFYVSNLPVGWNSSRLWHAVKHLGFLVDAYIPVKKDRGGLIFGFVRFARVTDTVALLKRLNELVLEGRRIFANIARYGRELSARSKVEGRPDGGKHRYRTPVTKKNGQVFHNAINHNSMSFKDSLMANTVQVIDKKKYEHKITIPQAVNLRSDLWLKNCLVGELKDLELLTKCMSMIQNYGLGDCKVKFIGGLCVLLEFKNNNVADCFLKNQEVNWGVWFAWLKHWDESYTQKSRVVWLKIYGVPINLWDPTVFTCIAAKYGRILIPLEGSLEAKNLSYGRVCILTSNLEYIDAHSVQVEWRNKNFIIRIVENGEWYPNSLMIPSERDSDEDYELDLDDLLENFSGEEAFDNRDEGDDDDNFAMDSNSNLKRDEGTDRDSISNLNILIGQKAKIDGMVAEERALEDAGGHVHTTNGLHTSSPGKSTVAGQRGLLDDVAVGPDERDSALIGVENTPGFGTKENSEDVGIMVPIEEHVQVNTPTSLSKRGGQQVQVTPLISLSKRGGQEHENSPKAWVAQVSTPTSKSNCCDSRVRNKIGSDFTNILGSLDQSSPYYNSIGPTYIHMPLQTGLPVINCENDLNISNTVHGNFNNSGAHMIGNKSAHINKSKLPSIRLKDVLFNSNISKSKIGRGKYKKNVSGGVASSSFLEKPPASDHANNNPKIRSNNGSDNFLASEVSESQTNSGEIHKKVEMGSALGYDMNGAESMLMDILVVEGEIPVTK